MKNYYSIEFNRVLGEMGCSGCRLWVRRNDEDLILGTLDITWEPIDGTSTDAESYVDVKWRGNGRELGNITDFELVGKILTFMDTEHERAVFDGVDIEMPWDILRDRETGEYQPMIFWHFR